jgi:hypothetical protein
MYNFHLPRRIAMGDPTYEAIRARERAEAERERAGSEVTKTAIAAFVDFFNGRATLSITPPQATEMAWQIRFIRDPPARTS